MNEKVMRHKAICDELNSLYERKNHDYGDSFHQTFVEEGLAMTRIRLGDKFSRFKTLSRLSANDAGQQQVTDESIRDTLMDLANYAIMTILEMDEEKGMETPDPNAASMAIGACSARSDIRAGLRLNQRNDGRQLCRSRKPEERCTGPYLPQRRRKLWIWRSSGSWQSTTENISPRRLRTYYDAFHDRIKELVSRYEMEDQDDIWLCTQMLKRIGVDVEAWHKESEHGT